MREFFKYVFATVIGVVISLALFLVFFIVLIVGIVKSSLKEDRVTVNNNSILFLNLDQTITERTLEDPFSKLPVVGSEASKSIGFNDVIHALHEAKTDDNIKCVYLTVSSPQAGFATMREIRDALIDFKTSKKKIIAYSEVLYSRGLLPRFCS
jgi:protease-4